MKMEDSTQFLSVWRSPHEMEARFLCTLSRCRRALPSPRLWYAGYFHQRRADRVSQFAYDGRSRPQVPKSFPRGGRNMRIRCPYCRWHNLNDVVLERRKQHYVCPICAKVYDHPKLIQTYKNYIKSSIRELRRIQKEWRESA